MSYGEARKQGGLAVITGAANGIGAAAAMRLAADGFDPVLVDMDAAALEATAEEIGKAHPEREVRARVCDVANAAAMSALAQEIAELGPVAVLMNNAGLVRPAGSWTGAEGWTTVLGVNLMGVIHGQMAFVPAMVEAARPSVVINTGSKQGITTPPGNAAYNVSKAGVKVATEMLAHDLREAGVPISAHLFVPGFVYSSMIAKFVPEKPPGAWTPEEVVAHLFIRLEAGDFYILCPDNDVTPARDRARIEWALGDMLDNRPALSRWHPDWADAFAAHEGRALKS